MQSRRLSLLDVLLLVTALAMAMMFIPSALSMSDQADKLKKCGANLRGLGQALYIYAQDDDYFPNVAGVRKENDGAMILFSKDTRDKAPATDAVPSPTVDLFTLLRANNSTVRQFVCPLTKDKPDPAKDTTEYFDFLGADNLSYAYQYQYDPDRPRLSTGSDPVLPLMADANPYLKGAIKEEVLKDRLSPASGNSFNHGSKRPSQNVLFLDAHVQLLKSPDAGKQGPVDKELLPKSNGRDNIFTVHEDGKQMDPGAAAPTATKCNLGSKSDSCLVP